MKFNQLALANASAVWMGMIYLLCGLAIAMFPESSQLIVRSWFHGIDLTQIWSAQPFPGNYFFGLLSAIGFTWVGAYFFASLYNYFLGKK
jgi:hypothetical protein